MLSKRRAGAQAGLIALGRRAAGGPLRGPVRAAYTLVVGAEAAGARAWASRRRVAPYAGGDVTVTIKSLARTLRSLRPVFAGPILVADDSAAPLASPSGVRVLRLPYDSGIGAGRTALLAAVETEFVLMADDDFIFLPDFDIARAVAYLRRNPEVDLVGGRVVNLPQLAATDYTATRLYARPAIPRAHQGSIIDGLPVRHKVANFYLARTAAVRAVGYDPALKRMDHADFFTSAYGRLVCVEDHTWFCLHDKTRFDRHYLAHREDLGADLTYVAAKWGPPQDVPAVREALSEDARNLLHENSIRVVAGDAGLAVGTGFEGTLIAWSPAADELGAALRAAGWAPAGARRLHHRVWGPVRLRTAPAIATTPPHPAAAAAGQWQLAPRVAAIESGAHVIAAPLPDGPALVLSPVAEAVWRVLTPAGATPQEILDAITDEDSPPDAAAALDRTLAELAALGLLLPPPVERAL